MPISKEKKASWIIIHLGICLDKRYVCTKKCPKLIGFNT